ncbi:uncharacterized protein PSFLO_05269 [Pseudozyma flocculosa]|uniref:Uncharacterized protein n=1 Tax=Pseudozyma flocculosa TaxID=84751 RepID=A0A5C3F5L5_9BASI|nr:uncharacterized protein PSFLO_05269 [Pseudozyma flocculosa]
MQTSWQGRTLETAVGPRRQAQKARLSPSRASGRSRDTSKQAPLFWTSRSVCELEYEGAAHAHPSVLMRRATIISQILTLSPCPVGVRIEAGGPGCTASPLFCGFVRSSSFWATRNNWDHETDKMKVPRHHPHGTMEATQRQVDATRRSTMDAIVARSGGGGASDAFRTSSSQPNVEGRVGAFVSATRRRHRHTYPNLTLPVPHSRRVIMGHRVAISPCACDGLTMRRDLTISGAARGHRILSRATHLTA